VRFRSLGGEGNYKGLLRDIRRYTGNQIRVGDGVVLCLIVFSMLPGGEFFYRVLSKNGFCYPASSTWPPVLEQSLEDLEAALQCLILDGVGDAEVGLPLRKDRPGDNQEFLPDRLGDELFIGPPGYLREDIKRPAGLLHPVA